MNTSTNISCRVARTELAILDVFSAGRYTLMTFDAAEPITAYHVSAEFFAVLGVSPVRGRLFTEGDDVPSESLPDESNRRKRGG
jgi:hypothetical protein